MPDTLLQTYLNKQFIKTADPTTISNLKKASDEVAKRLGKAKAKVIPYTLVAIDPLISENDPVVEEVEKIIITKWTTFKNSVALTKDKATTYIRVVILEALSQLAKDENFAAIIWHTSRNVISYYKTANEGISLEEFLREMGTQLELRSREYWSLNNTPQIEGIKEISLIVENGVAIKISQEKLTSHLIAATVHSGWSNRCEGGENPHSQGENNYNWPKFLAERAAKGLTVEINTAFDSQYKVLGTISNSIQKELNKYFSQLQPFFKKIAHSLTQGVIANNKRSNLLWWKQTLYSPTLDKSYRELSPEITAIILAIDLAEMVSPIYPVSVDYLLKETLKDVHGTQINTQEDISSWIAKFSEIKIQDYSFIQPWADEQVGRKPLLKALANILTNEVTVGNVFDETGIDKKAKISLAELAVWLFHDLQAVKIASSK